MKRGWLLLIGLLFIGNVSALCNLDISLVNQDPYPAVQGDYVKLLFQARGIESVECQDAEFTLMPEYPFSLNPGDSDKFKINGGTFTTEYNSYLMIPFKVRVDSNAIDGNNTIKMKYTVNNGSSPVIKNFDIELKDIKTNFEVYVKDYNPLTNILTFEILNSGKNNVEGLTLEILDQNNVKIKGPSYKIIGALDSNDFTTATYEAIPSSGEIQVSIQYTDNIYQRRQINKTVYFNINNFSNRVTDKKSNNYWIYIIVVILILIVGYYFYNKKQKEKKKRLFG